MHQKAVEVKIHGHQQTCCKRTVKCFVRMLIEATRCRRSNSYVFLLYANDEADRGLNCRAYDKKKIVATSKRPKKYEAHRTDTLAKARTLGEGNMGMTES